MESDKDDKKPKLITIQQAVFDSLLDRIDRAAITGFEEKVKDFEERVKNINSDIKNQKRDIRKIDYFLWVVVVVLLIGFATLLAQVGGMVIETWRFNSSVYEGSQEVNLQNNQYQTIINSLQTIQGQTKK